MVLRQASEVEEKAQLYGSVSTRDLATLIAEGKGFTVGRNQIALNAPIPPIGQP